MLGIQQIARISDLTRAQAHNVIATKIEQLIEQFHPGAQIVIEVRLAENEGGACFYQGNAHIVRLEREYSEGGVYMNAVIDVHELQRTVHRSMVFLRRHAKVTAPSTSAAAVSTQIIADYRKTQKWFRFIVTHVDRIWQEMCQNSELIQRASSKMPRLLPTVKTTLISHIIGYLERGTKKDHVQLTEEDIREAIQATAGHIIF